MPQQPLNKLAPNEVLGEDGTVLFSVDEAGVQTNYITVTNAIVYPDGSMQTTAPSTSVAVETTQVLEAIQEEGLLPGTPVDGGTF